MDNIKVFLKLFVMVFAICGILLAGANNVKAQMPCTNPGASTSLAFSIEWGALASEIMSSQSLITTFYGLAANAVVAAVMDTIQKVTGLGQDFMEQFMDFDLRPAMQDMTAELNISIIDALRAKAGCIDAQEFVKVQLHIKDAEVEAHRASRPSVLQCQAATISGGLFRQDTIKDAYSRAAPMAQAPLSGASLGTPAAQGDDVYLDAMWSDYCTRYVDLQTNQGRTGCPVGPPPTFPEENIKAENLFLDTYDVTDADLKKNVDDFIRNICGVKPIKRVHLEVLDTTPGREVFMEGMSRMAQEQLCFTAFYHIQSKRVPGSQMDAQILPHILKGGVNVIAANPSWTTIENSLEASTSQDFQTMLVDEPETVQRFLIIPDIYARTYGVNEIKDIQERTAALLAVIGARELNLPENAMRYDVRQRQ